MNKTNYFLLIFADLFALLSFFLASQKLLSDYSNEYIKDSSYIFIFVIPAIILGIFLILRIIKSLGIISSNTANLMVNPIASAAITFFGAGFGLPQISDFPHASLLFIAFSFIFSKSLNGTSHYKKIRFFMWSILIAIPLILTYVNIPNITNSESMGYFIFSMFWIVLVLGAFGFVIDSLLKNRESDPTKQF